VAACGWAIACAVVVVRPAVAWQAYEASTGAMARWYAPSVPYAVTDRLVALAPDEATARGVVAEAFSAWQDVECTLCHDPVAISCPPVSCAANPLGLTYPEASAIEPHVTPGPACVQTDSDGACTAYEPDGNQITAVTDPAEWAALGQSATLFAFTVLAYDDVSGQIRDADVVINAARSDYEVCFGPCASGGLDALNTLTHEVGHLHGLDHSTVPEATMRAGGQVGETFMRTLEADDVLGICTLYRTAWQPEGPPSDCGEGGGGRGCSALGRAPRGGGGPVGAALLGVVVLWLVVRRARPAT
jgi:hypothetical protein